MSGDLDLTFKPIVKPRRDRVAWLLLAPALLVFLLFQGYFEKGITVGAVKG